MQQIYRRTPIPKCDFNKFARQLHESLHLGMGILLETWCIFSEHLFIRTTMEHCFWKLEVSKSYFMKFQTEKIISGLSCGNYLVNSSKFAFYFAETVLDLSRKPFVTLGSKYNAWLFYQFVWCLFYKVLVTAPNKQKQKSSNI